MADGPDWLGGYTIEELLAAKPITKTKKELRKEAGKRSFLNATLGAPFRLVGALVTLPATIVGGVVKLPFRLIGAVLKPLRRKK